MIYRVNQHACNIGYFVNISAWTNHKIVDSFLKYAPINSLQEWEWKIILRLKISQQFSMLEKTPIFTYKLFEVLFAPFLDLLSVYEVAPEIILDDQTPGNLRSGKVVTISYNTSTSMTQHFLEQLTEIFHCCSCREYDGTYRFLKLRSYGLSPLRDLQNTQCRNHFDSLGILYQIKVEKRQILKASS
jgi:hypothetical protein